MYNIEFPELVFNEPGVYLYTVKEHGEHETEWITDKRVFQVIITVVYDSEGRLAASAEYPDGLPVFINRKKRRCICVCCCCYCCKCCKRK